MTMHERKTDMKPTVPHSRTPPFLSGKAISRREVLAGTAAVGAMAVSGGETAAAVDGKKTFTILHTNDLHSNLIGLGPALDYSPFTLNDDRTRGGFARLATLIANRKTARQDQGPVLVLDAGDYSMGTAFGAAIRETGGELQLLSRMGYDARPSAITISTSDLTV
jgi:5'-nucleotidase / UDP-sugar diphosphatase